MTSSAGYLRFELVRAFRNRRFFVLSFGFPIVMYFLLAAPRRHDHLGATGLPASLYFMVSLAAWGTMTAMLGMGARIAAERAVGWNRQLRITPLSEREYLRTKVLTGYAMAVTSLLLLYAAGVALGVRLDVAAWLQLTVLILAGLLPFAALGVLAGHLLSAESIGPAIGGATALLALLSGTWFPVTGHGVLHALAQGLPSYWLVQANRVALHGQGWGATGWAVVLAWTLVLTRAARAVYRRDTGRP